MASPPLRPDPGWEILEKYREALVAQARAILDNLADAEDVVQEIFVKAIRHRDKLQDEQALGAWLRAINRCNALNRMRGRKSDSQRMLKMQNLEPETTFTTGGFSIFELRETVDKALAELPEDLQLIVRLRYFEHRSYKQIADAMNVPVGTVSSLLMDALVKLYAKLKKPLENAAPDQPPENQAPRQPAQPGAPDEDDLPTQFARGVV